MANSISNLKLSDFARMVRMDASGGFATSIEKTSGNIYVDKSGKVHNASSLLTLAKGDPAKNLALRNQLATALSGHKASAGFMQEVRSMLGLKEDGSAASAEANKPLARMVVKQLLSVYTAGRFKEDGKDEMQEVSEGRLRLDHLWEQPGQDEETGSDNGWIVLNDPKGDRAKTAEKTAEKRESLCYSAETYCDMGCLTSESAQRVKDVIMQANYEALKDLESDLEGCLLPGEKGAALENFVTREKRVRKLAQSIVNMLLKGDEDELGTRLTDMLEALKIRFPKGEQINFSDKETLLKIADIIVRRQAKVSEAWANFLKAKISSTACEGLDDLIRTDAKNHFAKINEKANDKKDSPESLHRKACRNTGLDSDFVRCASGLSPRPGLTIPMEEAVTINGQKVAKTKLTEQEVQEFQDAMGDGEFSSLSMVKEYPWEKPTARLHYQMLNLLPKDLKNRNVFLHFATSMMGLQGPNSVFASEGGRKHDIGFGDTSKFPEQQSKHKDVCVGLLSGDPISYDLTVKNDANGKPSKLVMTQTYLVKATIDNDFVKKGGLAMIPVEVSTFQTSIEIDLTSELDDQGMPMFSSKTTIVSDAE